ncbi:hypothetical protein ACWGOK_37685 [Streptomyces eurythermus]
MITRTAAGPAPGRTKDPLPSARTPSPPEKRRNTMSRITSRRAAAEPVIGWG